MYYLPLSTIYLVYCSSWASTIDLHSDLNKVRHLFGVLDTLLEVLDPLQEGVAGGVAEDMEDEEEYRGQLDSPIRNSE